ncbi:MAG: ABC transporter permease [Lachnospiraceae bacterium]|nr:ABC transporter permease [Lachnospiraceae bacterium]
MKISDLLRMSLGSLFKRKVRTILTVLGVIIGTTSIVVMISLGIGMKSSMLEEMMSYENLTSIEVTISEQGRDSGKADDKKKEEMHLDDALIRDFSSLPYVKSVDPILEVPVILKCGPYMAWESVQGVTPEYLEGQNIELAQGGLPLSRDELTFLYGNTIIRDFTNEKNQKGYWETGELPDIDYEKDAIFAVFDTDRYWSAGTVDENGQIIPAPKKFVVPTAGVVAGGIDDWNQYSYYVYCNIDALKTKLQKVFKGRAVPGQPTRKSGKPYKELFYSRLMVNVVDMDHVTEVQKMINEMGYQTYASVEWIESDMQVMNIIQAVLGGIGAVSLLVAAIGITNTMMMSIYERTKEIGIMKVIGCRVLDVQLLFLIEAGYIGLIGGVFGVLLSYGLSVVVNKVVEGSELGLKNLSQIPFWLAGTSIIFAILIAMLAGLAPSIRATKLSPLSAIRAE